MWRRWRLDIITGVRRCGRRWDGADGGVTVRAVVWKCRRRHGGVGGGGRRRWLLKGTVVTTTSEVLQCCGESDGATVREAVTEGDG